MNVIKRKSLAIACLLGGASGMLHALPSTMHSLTDDELAATQGQALLNLSYMAPSDSGNHQANTGFYRLGLEAQLELNINARKLQLGCGGINGAGGCDIDIDNLSLSGNSSTREGRASSDAVLTNPFIEFAIKNPGSAATREITGMRLSAANASGLLTAGTNNSSTPNGINSLSGYLKVQSDSSGLIKGIVQTSPYYLDTGAFNAIGNPINGTLTVVGGVATADFHLVSGGFWVPGFSNVNFSLPGVLINERRKSVLTLIPQVSLPQLALGYTPDDGTCGGGASSPCNTYGTPDGPSGTNKFPSGSNTQPSSAVLAGTQGGPVVAQVDSCTALGFIPCSIVGINNGDQYTAHMYGKVTNIKADVTVNQSLGLIHSLVINSPASLSLQKEDMNWPGQTYYAPGDTRNDTAQRGWWLSLSDPVNLGNLTPVDPVNLCEGGITNAAKCVGPQIVSQVNSFLNTNNPNTNDINGLFTRSRALAVPIGTLPLSTLSLTVDGLVLSNQFFAPNCYGTLTFC